MTMEIVLICPGCGGTKFMKNPATGSLVEWICKACDCAMTLDFWPSPEEDRKEDAK
jgi:hypothetical protein